MIWRWRRKLLPKISCFHSNSPSLASVRYFTSPIAPPTDNKPKKSHPFKSSTKPILLNPQIVQTTLQNCPSDLTALSYFLWCAKQHNYFHDKPTFHHMVPVLSNLTREYGTVKGIVHELEAIGCVTKAQTLLLLMRIYWCGAMYDMVIEAYEEMGSYGYVPNTYVRNIVMDVLFKINSVDAALRFLEETKAPNFLSFSTAVCNLCRLNEVDYVKVVLRCMLMKGYYMNPETYSLVLNCFCKFGRLGEALQLLNMMIVLGAPISVNVWSILIDGLCKSGQIEAAAYFLEKMIEIGCSPNIVTCTSLIKGFLESRMPVRAFEILDNLESKGCFPDLVLCNVLIDCLSKMGWYKDAFEVFDSLKERSLVPDVYTFSSLVSAVCLSRAYGHLPHLISGFPVQPDLVVLNCLLVYWCKAGYPEGAVDSYNDMIEGGFVPDKYSVAGVLSALCRLGRINEAVNVYNGRIRSQQDVDAHIHTIIVNGLIKSGSLQKAVGVFGKAARKFSLDVVSYNVVIDGLFMVRKREEAYALFRQMKKMDITPDKHSYNLILSGFVKDRNFEMVKCTLQEMVDRNIELGDNTYGLMAKSGLLPKVEMEEFLLLDRDEKSSSSDDLSDVFEFVG